MGADSVIRARIETATKKRAEAALEAMGLSVSDAIRLLMVRIAKERRFPFDVKVPNVTTRKAIEQLERVRESGPLLRARCTRASGCRGC